MSEADIPEELAAELAANATAAEVFATMAPSHRRRYAEHVSKAVKPETRPRRALKMADVIAGKTP